ncbi:Telomeric repeat-binding factor [Thalictrum thalictroides]|uniref:Telomeric repeat-binding factor n=1 Tax=Thalictrum thalictroides TaxID=46969 RepID=A0A7J6WHK5_THATH|nr:Telomeric repeat-binding factor [Thalictrum thalictroides]
MAENKQKRWTLEFLLRQPIEDQLLIRLISTLSLSTVDHRLMKTLLLRRVSSEIQKGLVSEKILESLEQIEEIDYQMDMDIEILDSMKEAYCAVVVDSVVSFMKENANNISEYNNVISRVCRGRLLDLKRAKEVGLVLDWPKDLANELNAELGNVSIDDYLLTKDTRSDALKLVRVYLEEATQEMGPPFLELAVQTLSENRNEVHNVSNTSIADDDVGVRQEGFFHDQGDDSDENTGNNLENNSCNIDADNSVFVDKLPECREVNESSEEETCEMDPLFPEFASKSVNEKVNEIQVPTNAPLDSQIGVRQECLHDVLGENLDNEDATLSGDRLCKMGIDYSVEGPNRTTMTCDPMLTPEFRRVQEALRSSVSDLRDVVNDPLPDALCMAANVVANIAKEGMNSVQSVENHDEVDINRHNHSFDKGSEDSHAENGNIRNQAAVARPSLMERNPTAHTYEWDGEEIESSSEGSQNRPHLPTPKGRLITPLKRHTTMDIAERRKRKKWSSLEEETLIDAVKEYGRGNWKRILDNYSEIFEERTTIDLKDKWRNMTR